MLVEELSDLSTSLRGGRGGFGAQGVDGERDAVRERGSGGPAL